MLDAVSWSLTIILTTSLLPSAHLSRSSISIRGGGSPQSLIVSHTKYWPIYTYDFHTLSLVENDFTTITNPFSLDTEGGVALGGWVNPTSYDSLYLPADLPRPALQPAIGLVLVHGVARYVMPSLIATLQTPDRIWRNRGINSLPRSHAWIDLFAPFVPKLSDLKYCLFEKATNDLRFLEDQDGNTAWRSMINTSGYADKNNYLPQAMERLVASSIDGEDEDAYCLNIEPTIQRFLSDLAANPRLDELRNEGFRLVDIPLPMNQDNVSGKPSMSLSPIMPTGQKIKAYITDFTQPSRLLELEDASILDNEPCGELDIAVIKVSEGRKSKFMPAVYRDLYEDGAVLF